MPKITLYITIILLAGFGWVIWRNISARPLPKQEAVLQVIVRTYQSDIQKFQKAVLQLKEKVSQEAPQAELQKAFLAARLQYKNVEFLTETYNPYNAKKINGAALDEIEVYDAKVLPPEGFQVIEEYLYPAYDPALRDSLFLQVEILENNVKHLEYVSENLTLTPDYVWDAIRNQFHRIIILGITGFDSPIANSSLPEAAQSLKKLQETAWMFVEAEAAQSQEVHLRLKTRFEEAIQYLQGHSDFNGFDRLYFIAERMNPLAESLWESQKALNITFFDFAPRPLRANIKTLFEPQAFNVDFYAREWKHKMSPEMAQLGKMLFFDPILSGNNQRACASCHQPEKAFTDGRVKSLAFDGQNSIGRNSPTLLNAALQGAFFWDARSKNLEHQALDVMSNANEMHSSLDLALEKIKTSEEYKALFAKAFPGEKEALSVKNLQAALGHYTRTLVLLNARFDRYMRGEKNALNTAEKRGFNIFAGKGKCATCHFIPLFNGTVPPAFLVSETEVIGVPARPDTANAQIDPDSGKYYKFKFPQYMFSFKTPTVRNAELTAPYMHNGVYQTLEEVVDFYNRGGGYGIGIELEYQTLPPDPLNLSPQEQADLVAFMKALNDQSGAYEKPARLPAIPGLPTRTPGGAY
ncbi:MAG: cytochrome-c peroxidase [Microscillaceae bacterium]|nr:cytochrome-c peroxidase [Microscillaceae bacterium]